jgi:hypothetical protein
MSSDMQAMLNNAWTATLGATGGPTVRGFSTQTPTTTYGGGYAVGDRLQLNVAGQITALWFYRSSTSTVTSRVLKLWDTGVTTLLATSNPTTETSGTNGWVQATLPTPYVVTAGQRIVISYDGTDAFTYTPGTSHPADVSQISWVAAVNGAVGSPPTNTDTGNYHFTDVSFQYAGPGNHDTNDFTTALTHIPAANITGLPTNNVLGSSAGTPTPLTLWKGTQAQYTALGTYDSNTVYVVV